MSENKIFEIEPAEFVEYVQKWIDDRLGMDTKVIDVRGRSSLADFIVITSGNNVRQVNAISQNIQDNASKMGIEPKNVEGERESRWILLDYYDVIIHVFSQEEREFYDLERLWQDDMRPSNQK
ncbi:MAG: ribosome silencing factor [Eubacteriaceae bacterium]|jgi:ribosome-associated protein|uniref:Ribosomal silencing factor RsfS n=1 Tax=Candidatus Pseudoramibacter fermentans TaxID=2594427 RepID=A0A6L5GRQ1_9FIRM|nr:ribosome silencing factor [Candidatus Pseudoramibacter fermentans]RRF93756.1 MAG: ribosome silencing factor [Eubacteriaceae bacterium]